MAKSIPIERYLNALLTSKGKKTKFEELLPDQQQSILDALVKRFENTKRIPVKPQYAHILKELYNKVPREQLTKKYNITATRISQLYKRMKEKIPNVDDPDLDQILKDID